MGLGEILLIMTIALILFGPEDLPDIARTMGKVIFEIRKAAYELTKEFQSPMDSPISILNKAFEQTTSLRVTEQEPHGAQENSTNDEKMLTLEDEIPISKESSKAAADDPLAGLPLDMVSYEEKGASR